MKEAIILAGGFGTRLKHIVSDVPKPMAPVGGEPFLSVLFERLQCAGIERVILSTGYLHEKIEDFYGDKYGSLSLVYSRETTPLGTGGAIQLGLNHSCTNDVLVLNGDTLFDIDFSAFYSFHRERKATLSVALRNVDDVTRYGSVETDNESRIVSFTEKNQVSGAGLINGGIYLLNKKWFLGLNMPEQFSFEKDVLEKIYQDNRFYGLAFNAYFIDIGVPEDYFRAQTEINPRHDNPNNRKALFLDRDGVINRQVIGGYVTKTDEFEFLPGVLDALGSLSGKFDYIFIVTNQQGIGKGIFSENDLADIHRQMCNAIHECGGRVDKIYYCPALEKENSPFRKPDIGMGKQALSDFPGIDLSSSVMVGDSVSDMLFGKNMGLKTVFLTNGKPVAEADANQADEIYLDLADFAIRFC